MMRVNFSAASLFLTLVLTVPASLAQEQKAHPAYADGAVQDRGVKTITVEIRFTSYDGYKMFGKLTIPATTGSHPVVIYVQTAEGMTVDMKRQKSRDATFNYFDLYREKLPEMNVAFFSYEGRGIRMGDKPPRYETIDWSIYNTSTLENKCAIL